MNDMWSSRILSYTIVLVGLGTYFVVFNLNNIVTHGSRAYQPIRRRIVDDMKEPKPKDAGSKQKDSSPGFWSEHGEKLDLFTPKHEKIRPSEWWVFIFLFTSIWHRLKIFGKKKKGEVWKRGSSTSKARPLSDTFPEDLETDDSGEDDSSTISSPVPLPRTSAEDHEAEPADAEIQVDSTSDNHHESPRVSRNETSATSRSEQIPKGRIRAKFNAALKSRMKRRDDSRMENSSTMMDQQNTLIPDSLPPQLNVLQEPKTVAQRLSGILRRRQGDSSVERGGQEIV